MTTDPYVSGDPFVSARRARVVGPVMILIGAGVLYLGITGDRLAWLLCVLGGVIALLGLIRFLGGTAVLLFERRRVRVLREGTPATAVIKSSRQVRTQAGYPIFESELVITLPGGRSEAITRRSAIPPQYAGEFTPGTELPGKVDPDDLSTFALDWDAF